MGEPRYKYSIFLSLDERLRVKKLEEKTMRSFSGLCRALLLKKCEEEKL